MAVDAEMTCFTPIDRNQSAEHLRAHTTRRRAHTSGTAETEKRLADPDLSLQHPCACRCMECCGDEIIIEERPPEEVTTLKGQRIAAEGISVRNPSFDVTPAEYITAIITDQGVHKAPFERALRSAVHQTKAGPV